jgi:hypothetical protein
VSHASSANRCSGVRRFHAGPLSVGGRHDVARANGCEHQLVLRRVLRSSRLREQRGGGGDGCHTAHQGRTMMTRTSKHPISCVGKGHLTECSRAARETMTRRAHCRGGDPDSASRYGMARGGAFGVTPGRRWAPPWARRESAPNDRLRGAPRRRLFDSSSRQIGNLPEEARAAAAMGGRRRYVLARCAGSERQ